MLDDRWQSLTATHVSLPPDGDRRRMGAPIAGLVHLDDLCALRFHGADVINFLQGYLTCDTGTLDAEKPSPAALCNLKGRVIAFGWCLAPTEDQILWLVPGELVSSLQTFLKPYLAFSKTRLTTLSEDHLLLGCIETERPGNIAANLSIHLVNSSEALESLWADCGPGDRDEFDIQLIKAGIPWISTATSQQFLPQMIGLVALGAVSFDKGCYLGQEVVARAQHRGQVKRQLKTLHQQTGQRAAAGATLLDAQGRAVGSIIQSASSSTEAASLAVIQSDAEGPFQEQDTGLPLLF